MKCECGGATHVIDTRKAGNSIRRFRKCRVCERKYVTMESFVEAIGKVTPADKPDPVVVKKKKAATTKPVKAPVTTAKQRKVEVRRRLEDLKNRVPSYYIEDDEY